MQEMSQEPKKEADGEHVKLMIDFHSQIQF
jgi:hypothetical protein